MKTSRVIKVAHRLSRPFRIDGGRESRLKDVDSGDTWGLEAEEKPRAKEALGTARATLGAEKWVSRKCNAEAMDPDEVAC